MNPMEQPEIKRQVDELLWKWFVHETIAPVLCPHYSHLRRMAARECVDNQAIDKITVKYSFPIPRHGEMIDTMEGSVCLLKIDLGSGYY